MTAKQLKLVQSHAVTGWRDRINAAWQKGVESIIETGRLLIEAKAELEHGRFGKMIEMELSFGASTAQQLMAIASDNRLTKAEHVQYLPPSWGTLYQLTKLPDDTFEAAIKNEDIHPKMERKDVAALLGKTKPAPADSDAPLKWIAGEANMRLLEAIEREFERYGAKQSEAPIIAYFLTEHAKGLTDGTDGSHA